MASPKFVVVIGTSAGGLRALEELVLQLNPDMDAAFFIVIHLSRKGIGSYLISRIQQFTSLKCKLGEDKEPIERGIIYVAPPDHHMLIATGMVVIGKGAPENRWRPSINNLFRSAAANYNSSVIGIILTGLLDDGASGMSMIKQSGGLTVVQDPNEADYPDMPLSVLDNIDVDYVESISKMGVLLKEITDREKPQPVQVPDEIIMETQMDYRVGTRIDDLAKFEKFEINCPDCGGGLWVTQKEHPIHFRCHVGHSFTERELLIRVSEVMENTFWASLRMMEERRTLLMRMAQKNIDRGYASAAQQDKERAEEMDTHINNLKQIIYTATQVD